MGNNLLRLPIDHLRDIPVVVLDIRVNPGQRQLLDGVRRAGGHGLGQPGGSDNRHRVVLLIAGGNHNLAVYMEVLNHGSAVQALYVPSGQVDEVAGAHLHSEHNAPVLIREGEGGGEAVVNLLIGHVREGGVHRLGHPAHHHVHLVQQVHAPVKDHAAAMLLGVAPVTGDAPAAVDPALDGEHPAQLAVLHNLFRH